MKIFGHRILALELSIVIIFNDAKDTISFDIIKTITFYEIESCRVYRYNMPPPNGPKYWHHANGFSKIFHEIYCQYVVTGCTKKKGKL